MISLVDFINESLLEESFFDYDTALEKVPAKMQDVEKLRILIKKFSKFGEEENTDNSPYEKLLDVLKSYMPEKKFNELETFKKSANAKYNAPYEEKLAVRTKYCDKMFAAIRKYGYDDYEFLIVALAGCADYIDNYSRFQQKDADKYIGKLANKFNKIFGVDVDGYTKISKEYNKLKIRIKDAVDLEAKTVESIKDIKDEFKNHKYTIFAKAHNTAACMLVVDNSKYENLDNAFNSTVAKEGSAGSPLEKYNLENILRDLVKDGKVPSLYLCSGNYCWGEDKDNKIPLFGYLDNIPSDEIYEYSNYDNKFYYKGKLNDKQTYYKWYDNLWTVHKK